MLQSTRHEELARDDYNRILRFGMRTIRVAVRWHLIEQAPGEYSFHSLEPLLDAADDKGLEVSLDLLHFGWPEHIDIFSPNFPERFAAFTRSVIRYLKRRTVRIRFIAPVNEVSYLAWAGGEVGCIGPFQKDRGNELKRNIIRAGVASCETLLNEYSGVRLISPEPVIHIIGDPAVPGDEEEAALYSKAMFQGWDMISGRLAPELGGRPEYLDIIGVNFYERNEWVHNFLPITREHPRWRPFSDILREVWERYRRPMFVAETGTEDDARAGWFSYVCDQARTAIADGIPLYGICLYPVLNHCGWDDDRHCHNGLFDYADEAGERPIHLPLAEAILREQQRFADFFATRSSMTSMDSNLNADLICLSHLRWGFVFQRPQHLMSRFARSRRVFFVEEPVFEDGPAHLRTQVCERTGVRVCTPVLPHGTSPQDSIDQQRALLDSLMAQHEVARYILWNYTPMAREFSRHLQPDAVVYDCMDELSAFAGAPPAMRTNEQELFRHADLVFTGGATLYEAKKKQHSSVHCMPSSVEIEHFAQARNQPGEPEDQKQIPHPRIGYAGVIDERMDLNLLKSAAAMRPDWHFVLLGPTCKIDPATLPQCPNIHYLGMKSYADLPAYFSGWEVGMLPFAINESTKYISPTKTPEYLAAGLKAVSTPIRDVVTPYGDMGLVEIAGDPVEFISKTESLLNSPLNTDFRARVDAFLSQSSWDKTWSNMNDLIEGVLKAKRTSVSRTFLEQSSSSPATLQGKAHV